MYVDIIMRVDMDDLDIDYKVYHDSLTTEAWGIVQTDKWTEVEINSITYNDQEVELTEASYDELRDYLADDYNYGSY